MEKYPYYLKLTTKHISVAQCKQMISLNLIAGLILEAIFS